MTLSWSYVQLNPWRLSPNALNWQHLGPIHLPALCLAVGNPFLQQDEVLTTVTIRGL